MIDRHGRTDAGTRTQTFTLLSSYCLFILSSSDHRDSPVEDSTPPLSPKEVRRYSRPPSAPSAVDKIWTSSCPIGPVLPGSFEDKSAKVEEVEEEEQLRDQKEEEIQKDEAESTPTSPKEADQEISKVTYR